MVPHDRLARLRDRMAQTGVDLVALGPTSHMRWLASLDPHGDERPVMLLAGRERAGVLMPALNAAAARAATDLPLFEWTDADGPDAALDDLLAFCGATGPGLGVSLDEMMRADHALRLLDRLERPRRGFAADTVGVLRARKDEAEVDTLRRSARANDVAVTAAFDALEEGMTEREVQAVIHASHEAQGARPEFANVAFGANGAFPHHHTGRDRLRRDMAVQIDAGCRLDGYPADMTRCGWLGTPDPEFLAVSALVEKAVQAALATVRPGVPALEVDRAARNVIAAGGHGERFVHRTGHGLGLDIHEAPYISSASNAVLEVGHVFSIEPGIYLEGRFGIRHEDVVVVREDGADVLSGLPRDLRIF